MPWAAAAAVARKDGDSQLGSSEVSGGTNGRESTIDGAHGLPFQMQMRNAYASQPVQLLVAGLIFANFILSAYEKQVLAPEGSPEAKVIYNWEVFFAVAFGIELLCNMYGHWFRAFWGSYGANTRSPLAQLAAASAYLTRMCDAQPRLTLRPVHACAVQRVQLV